MKAAVVPSATLTAATATGRVLAHDVEAFLPGGERVRLRKGRILAADDLPALHAADRPLHLLTLDPGDLHENAAGLRLARAVAGAGVIVGEPHESMITLRAATRGLLRVDTARLLDLNSVPDVSVWTRYDAQLVEERKPIAGVKVTPLVTTEAAIGEAEVIAAGDADHPIITVRPFVPRRAGVIVREQLLAAAGARFREAITTKVHWFGSEIVGIVAPPDDEGAIIAAMRGLVAHGADMLLVAGVTSTDPLDLTVRALDAAGARWEKRGVPAHPGSTYWLAYLDNLPVLGMASCGMFSRATVLDLILPRFFAGERVTARTLAALGHGGLLNRDMTYRFPDYASGDIAATASE